MNGSFFDDQDQAIDAMERAAIAAEGNGFGYPRPTSKQQSTAPTPALRIWTANEIWKPLEPPDYLAEGLLVRGALALVVAYGSSLKTWVLEDAALSVATGAPWLGRFPVKKGRALIVDFESGDYELRRRAHRIAKGRGFDVPVEGFAFASMPECSLADSTFYDALAPLATEYAFIGIDSLAAGSGGIDENDARFATSLQRLKSLAARTGCVIVVLHHSRKGSGEDADPREAVRGTSAIFNACDVVLQLTRTKDGTFTVQQTKARGGRTVDPFGVRVDDVSEDGTVVVASDLHDAGATEIRETSRAIANAARAIVLLLGSEHAITSKNQIYNRIAGSKPDKIKALGELIEAGTVREHQGAWRLTSEVTP